MILERHNTVLSELNLSQSEPLFLLSSEWTWNTPKLLERTQENLLELDAKAMYWQSIRVDEEMYQHLFVSIWIWRETVFDPILRLTANDKLANVMIVDCASKWLYHPYDGGADVILASTDERNILRDKYKMWLSNHPSGY